MKQVLSVLIKRNNKLALSATVSGVSSHVDCHDCPQRTPALCS